jgi:hypothetical protein
MNGPLSASLSLSKGERVPKAGEGTVQGFKARIPSGNSLPNPLSALRWRGKRLRIPNGKAAMAGLGEETGCGRAELTGESRLADWGCGQSPAGKYHSDCQYFRSVA